MDDYAGRVLADRYRLPLPSDDAYELAETRAFDTYSGQEVLVRQVPLPEVVDAEVLDGDDAYGTPDAYTRGGASGYGGPRPGYGRTTRRPADPAVRRAVEAAQAAAQIPDHPRLDQVFDVFAQDGSLWIVSELVAARPLSALLAERPLNPFRAAEVASDVLTALRVLHAHGWTHRNITARTVLICDDGRVVLTGLAVGAARGGAVRVRPRAAAAGRRRVRRDLDRPATPAGHDVPGPRPRGPGPLEVRPRHRATAPGGPGAAQAARRRDRRGVPSAASEGSTGSRDGRGVVRQRRPCRRSTTALSGPRRDAASAPGPGRPRPDRPAGVPAGRVGAAAPGPGDRRVPRGRQGSGQRHAPGRTRARAAARPGGTPALRTGRPGRGSRPAGPARTPTATRACTTPYAACGSRATPPRARTPRTRAADSGRTRRQYDPVDRTLGAAPPPARQAARRGPTEADAHASTPGGFTEPVSGHPARSSAHSPLRPRQYSAVPGARRRLAASGARTPSAPTRSAAASQCPARPAPPGRAPERRADGPAVGRAPVPRPRHPARRRAGPAGPDGRRGGRHRAVGARAGRARTRELAARAADRARHRPLGAGRPAVPRGAGPRPVPGGERGRARPDGVRANRPRSPRSAGRCGRSSSRCCVRTPPSGPEFEELRGWLRSLVRSAPEPDAGARIAPAHRPGRQAAPDPAPPGRTGAAQTGSRAAPVPVAPPAEHRPPPPGRAAAEQETGSLARLLLLLILALLAAAIAYAVLFMPIGSARNTGQRHPRGDHGQSRRPRVRRAGASPAPAPAGTAAHAQQTQTTGPAGRRHPGRRLRRAQGRRRVPGRRRQGAGSGSRSTTPGKSVMSGATSR